MSSAINLASQALEVAEREVKQKQDNVKLEMQENACLLVEQCAIYIQNKLEECDYIYKPNYSSMGGVPYLSLFGGCPTLFCGNNDVFRIEFHRGEEPEIWIGNPFETIYNLKNGGWAKFKDVFEKQIIEGLQERLKKVQVEEENNKCYKEYANISFDELG